MPYLQLQPPVPEIGALVVILIHWLHAFLLQLLSYGFRTFHDSQEVLVGETFDVAPGPVTLEELGNLETGIFSDKKRFAGNRECAPVLGTWRHLQDP